MPLNAKPGFYGITVVSESSRSLKFEKFDISRRKIDSPPTSSLHQEWMHKTKKMNVRTKYSKSDSYEFNIVLVTNASIIWYNSCRNNLDIKEKLQVRLFDHILWVHRFIYGHKITLQRLCKQLTWYFWFTDFWKNNYKAFGFVIAFYK